MKKTATSNPAVGPNDTDKMRDAIEALNAEGVRFSRPTQYQLKIGDLNFYPGTGRIFRDGEDKAWDQQGLTVLISYLRERRKSVAKIIDFASSDSTIPAPGVDLSDIVRGGVTIPGADPRENSGNRVIRLVPKQGSPR